jgi:hypothetical protein
MRFVLTFIVMFLGCLQITAQGWSATEKYLLNPPSAIKYFNGDIYIQGTPVDTAGNILNNTAFARIKNNQWDTMGVKMSGINCFESYLDTLYIGGGGTINPPPGGHYTLLHFDGQTFASFPYPPNLADVNCLHIYENNLYIGGDFLEAYGMDTVNRIMYYDGQIAHKMGVGIDDVNGRVEAIHDYNGKVYVGGYFHSAGGIEVYHMARWTGSEWERIPDNPFWDWWDQFVWDFEVDTINNFLYVGANYGIWKYNNHWWELIGGQYLSASFENLKMYKKELYATPGGDLTIDTVAYGSVLRWDGAQWQKLNRRVGGIVTAFEIIDDTLWVGGPRFANIYNLGKWYHPEPTHCNWLQTEIYVTGMDTNIVLDDSGTVHFENNNAYAQSWQWDFGDGNTDSVQNPVHTYDQIGDLTVSVTVTMDGCTKTATLHMHITGIDEEKKTEQGYLRQNVPNPFNNTTVIPYYAPYGKTSSLIITDINGRQLQAHTLQPGNGKIEIELSGMNAGNYLYSIEIDGKIEQTMKFVKN